MQNLTSRLLAFSALTLAAGLSFVRTTPMPMRVQGTPTYSTFTYSSTVDAITDLFARVAYPPSGNDLPIVVLMHGFSDGAAAFSQASLVRIADNGLFVVAPGMRGRDGAGGSPDCGAGDRQDIADALSEVRARYPEASKTKAAIVGYSGGGSDALYMASRYPALFQVAVDHFGMTDYAAWWTENTGVNDRANLEARIGGTPAAVPSAYTARLPLTGIESFIGAIFVFHDQSDTRVPISHTTRAQDYFAAHSVPATVSITTGSDPLRWTHGYPDTGSNASHTEAVWVPAVQAIGNP